MIRPFILLIMSFLLVSCARVGSPVGGAKDTIPPKMTGSNIDSPRVNVPLNIRELRIDFDEYITLKDINKQLIISPPLKRITKILPAGMGNRYLLIKWADTLQPNTTYNFNFGNAVVDNNEGNPLAYFNFAFSTGEKIDSLFISGELKNPFATKESRAEEGSLVVGLYQDKDSLDYRRKPYYITKADPDGYFELNYLAPGKYRLLAFEDNNSNSVFDAGKEKVAFIKESVTLDKSISGLHINLLPSKKIQKYVEMKEVPGGVLMLFEGNPDQVKITPLSSKIKNYIVSHLPKSDSAMVWFDAKSQDVGITANENLKFSYNTGTKQDTVSLFYRYNKNEMTLSNKRGNLLPPKKNFTVSSNYIIEKIQPEKWTLTSDSLSQNFTAEISPANPFNITVKSDFKEGKKYSLTIPKETVSSYYDDIQKSYRFDFETDRTENYGDFTLIIENRPSENFWTQMLTPEGEVVHSHYGTAGEILFKAVKPGSYQIRILVDENGNNLWDPADLKENLPAEPYFIMEKRIDIRPLWEIRETWTLPAGKVEIPKESNSDILKSPTPK